MRIDGAKLAALAPHFERAVVQRLGYLLDRLGFSHAADETMHASLFSKTPLPWAPLEPRPRGKDALPHAEPIERNERWQRYRQSPSGDRRMIPAMNIIAWSQKRAVGGTASDRAGPDHLARARPVIRRRIPERPASLSRGGTALNKLHFPKPLRYSEDIDLVLTSDAPLRPILDRVHDLLDPWLGDPVFERSPVAPKFKYSVEGGGQDVQRPQSGSNSKSTRTSMRLSTQSKPFRSRWKIRGFPARPIFQLFHTKSCSRPSFARCSSATRAAIWSISRTRWRFFPKLDTQKTVDLFGSLHRPFRHAHFPRPSRTTHVQ